MKKLLLLLLITYGFSAKSQNAYFDAIMLNSKKDSINIVFDNTLGSNAPYAKFFDEDLVRKIYEKEEFVKINSFINNITNEANSKPFELNEKIDYSKISVLLRAFNLYKVFIEAQKDIDAFGKHQLDKIWEETDIQLKKVVSNDTCLKKYNFKTISVNKYEKLKSYYYANKKKEYIDRVLFLANYKFSPNNSVGERLIELSLFDDKPNHRDSLYFFIDGSFASCETSKSKISDILKASNDSLFKLIQTIKVNECKAWKKIPGNENKNCSEMPNDFFKSLTDKNKKQDFSKNFFDTFKTTFVQFTSRTVDGINTTNEIQNALVAKQISNTSPSVIGTSFDPTTRIIDATAQWLVKRTKQELTMSFYDKFREKLDTEEDIRLMLPATYTMLQNQENIYQIPTLSKVWASAFVTDIKRIPFNFEALVHQKYPEIAKKEDFRLFMITAHSFDMLGRGSHPADIFDFLNDTYGGDKKATETSIITQTIRLVDLFSKNLRDTVTIKIDRIKKDTTLNDDAWIKKEKLAKLKDPLIRRFYMGLLYQQDPQLFNDLRIKKSDGSDQSIKQYFTENKNFHYVDKTLSQILQFFNNIDTHLKTLRETDQEKQKAIKFAQYAQLVFDVVDIGFRIKYLMTEPNPDNTYYTSEYFKTWRPTGVNAIEGIKAFYNNNLGAGFMYTVQVIKPIWDKVGKTNANIEKIADAFEIITNFNRAELNQEKTNLNANIQQLNVDIIAINTMSPFGKAEINQLKAKYDELKTTNKELADVKVKIETYKQNLDYLDSYFLLSNDGAFKNIEDKIQQKKQEILDNIVPANTVILNDELKVLLKKQEKLCKIFINKDANEASGNKKVVLDQFIFYANFITDIITADSTTNLADIINRYAQPAGSYSIKRKNRWSIDVNAYPGLYVGIENPLGTSQLRQNNFINGITAPIGISLSKGKLHKGYKDNLVKGHSWSLFIPVVDIGAAFSYRWTNTSEDGQGLPKIKLSQIFSPGLYVAYGFKNFPISIMAGAQYTPQLREIIKTSKDTTITTTTENGVTKSVETIYNLSTKTEINTWRYGVSANVDISIFNLFHQRRKNK